MRNGAYQLEERPMERARVMGALQAHLSAEVESVTPRVPATCVYRRRYWFIALILYHEKRARKQTSAKARRIGYDCSLFL